jgi:hypothetical protein
VPGIAAPLCAVARILRAVATAGGAVASMVRR